MTMKLTEREEILAGGGNPDAVIEDTIADVEPGAAEAAEVTEAESVAGGKEAVVSKDAPPAKPIKEVVEPVVKAEPEVVAEEDDLDIDPEEYARDGYDEKTVKLAKFAQKQKDNVKQLKGEVKAIADKQAAAEQSRFIESFHDTLDTMDADLFGRSLDKDGNEVAISEDLDANRRLVFDRYVKLNNEIAAEAKKAGKEPKFPSMRSLLKTATEEALSKKLVAREAARVKSELAEQSKKRRPVAGAGARRPEIVEDKKSSKNLATEIANDPSIKKFLAQCDDANGTGK